MVLTFGQIALEPNPSLRAQIDFSFFVPLPQDQDRLAIAVPVLAVEAIHFPNPASGSKEEHTS